MQWTKRKSITAVFAISAAAAAAWFAFVSFDRAGAFDEKPESGWIHEECDYTDYYFNQHLNDGGVCTHDLSYTELPYLWAAIIPTVMLRRIIIWRSRSRTESIT